MAVFGRVLGAAAGPEEATDVEPQLDVGLARISCRRSAPAAPLAYSIFMGNENIAAILRRNF